MRHRIGTFGSRTSFLATRLGLDEFISDETQCTFAQWVSNSFGLRVSGRSANGFLCFGQFVSGLGGDFQSPRSFNNCRVRCEVIACSNPNFFIESKKPALGRGRSEHRIPTSRFVLSVTRHRVSFSGVLCLPSKGPRIQPCANFYAHW